MEAIGLMEAAIFGGTGQVKSERFYGFPSRSAQHDPYSGKLWVSTGDQDAECRVIQLDPDTGETTLVRGEISSGERLAFPFERMPFIGAPIITWAVIIFCVMIRAQCRLNS